MKFSKKLLIILAYYNIFGLGLYLSTYQYSLLRIAQHYGLDPVMTGFIVTIQYVGMTIPPLLIGTLSGRFGKKNILYVAHACLIAGALLIFAGGSFAVFAGALICAGAGFNVMESTSSAALVDEFPSRSRLHLCLTQVAFSIGGLLAPLISEALYRAGWTYRELFLGIGVLYLLGGVAHIFTEHLRTPQESVREESAYSAFRFFKTLPFVLLGLSLFLCVGIEEITGFYAGSYFTLVAGDANMSALALTLFWGLMIPSRLLGGVLKLKRGTILAFCSVLLAISLAGAMLVPEPAWKAGFFAVAGFALGPIWPMLMDYTGERYAGSTGPVMTIMMSVCCLGGASMPLLAGVFVKMTDYSIAYYIAAAAAIGSLAAYLGINRKRRARSEIPPA